MDVNQNMVNLKQEHILKSSNYNVSGEIISEELILKGKTFKNIDSAKLSKVIKGKLLLKEFIKESIIKENDDDEDKINTAIKLLKSVSAEKLKEKRITFNINNKEKNLEKTQCKNIDNKKPSFICEKKPKCYNQCDVPAFGYKNGWCGPEYWAFSKGLPYNRTFQ
tara:strand:- start:341 stop:835 length:495 start_codon:yes stop_codon:yes gene_type:complete